MFSSLFFSLNLSEFPTGCHLLQFSVIINMLDVFNHIGSGGLKQFGHLLLAQPHCFIIHTHINMRLSIFSFP